jgi:nicotinamide phosphoribosyltransferase
VNSKGFKVLHPNIRLIQGDGVNYDSIREILDMMVSENFSVENLVFGMGGALLQKVDRDTQKFAFKCCSIVVNGVQRNVQKNPVEIDKQGQIVQSFKTSKKGNLKLIQINGEFKTIEECEDLSDSLLMPVFKNGEILVDYTFEEIRKKTSTFFENLD